MLEVDSVNQYYGGSHILRNVTFTLPNGQLTVLLGRNGVGKTTLLRCLMGVVPIRTGKILWNKKPLERMAPYSRVTNGLAYVPQGRDIFPRLTVEENSGNRRGGRVAASPRGCADGRLRGPG